MPAKPPKGRCARSTSCRSRRTTANAGATRVPKWRSSTLPTATVWSACFRHSAICRGMPIMRAIRASGRRAISSTWWCRSSSALIRRGPSAMRACCSASASPAGARGRCLLRHPDMFDRAAAWDAPMTMERPRYGMAPIAGTQENFERYRVTTLLRERGTQLGSEPRLMLAGWDFYREQTQGARRLLQELKIPHAYRDGPQRPHHWNSGWMAELAPWLRAKATRRIHSPRIAAEIFSPTMMVGMLVLAQGTVGMIEASQTRKPLDAVDAAGRIGHRAGIVRPRPCGRSRWRASARARCRRSMPSWSLRRRGPRCDGPSAISLSTSSRRSGARRSIERAAERHLDFVGAAVDRVSARAVAVADREDLRRRCAARRDAPAA